MNERSYMSSPDKTHSLRPGVPASDMIDLMAPSRAFRLRKTDIFQQDLQVLDIAPEIAFFAEYARAARGKAMWVGVLGQAHKLLSTAVKNLTVPA